MVATSMSGASFPGPVGLRRFASVVSMSMLTVPTGMGMPIPLSRRTPASTLTTTRVASRVASSTAAGRASLSRPLTTPASTGAESSSVFGSRSLRVAPSVAWMYWAMSSVTVPASRSTVTPSLVRGSASTARTAAAVSTVVTMFPVGVAMSTTPVRRGPTTPVRMPSTSAESAIWAVAPGASCCTAPLTSSASAPTSGLAMVASAEAMR